MIANHRDSESPLRLEPREGLMAPRVLVGGMIVSRLFKNRSGPTGTIESVLGPRVKVPKP